jgi:RNA-binding protein 7
MTMTDVDLVQDVAAIKQVEQIDVVEQESVKEIPVEIQQQNKSNFQQQQQQQRDHQYSKDKTLFCINIDQRFTEDILFELFLQAGPIENLIRKPDRNGNIIALVTYKHIESVDYSIKLFDKILLFGQRLKVQLSNINQKVPATSAGEQTSTTTSPNLSSGYQKQYSRTQSYDNINRHQQEQQPIMQAPIVPPQFIQSLNLLQLMAQPLIQFNNQSPHHHHHHDQRYHNHSPNNHHSRYDNNSRNNHRSSQPHSYNRSRDNSYQSAERDRRSRSPRSNSDNRRR